MAKNKNKSAAPRMSRAEREAAEAKKYRRTRLALVIAAISAAAAILIVSIIAIVSAILAAETVDYLNDDLSKYVYIDEADYKGFKIEIDIDPIDDMAVDTALAKALYATRKNKDANYVSLPLGRDALRAGDTVYVRYIGYEMDSKGVRTYFDGGCNFGDASSYALGLGSGSFITGFESGIIGKNPADYSTLAVISNSPIKKGDVVMLTMSAIYADGTTAENTSYNVVVDESVCDARFGTGFADFLVGKSLGKVEGYFQTDDAVAVSGLSVYTDITISKIVDPGDNPLTVTARFPKNYTNDPTLASKTVYYDVYIEKMDLYEISEVDETFVNDKLGMTVEELAAYGDEGATLMECYHEYLKESIMESAKAENDSILTSAVWARLNEAARIKRLPAAEVNSYYEGYVDEITQSYNKSGSSYGTLDAYALTYLSLSESDDWRAHLKKTAENSVAEKLVFYYIIREQGLLPTDEEIAAIRVDLEEEIRQYILENLSMENYETEEEYLSAVEAYHEGMVASYGDDYFSENAIYKHSMGKLKELFDVVYK